MIPTSNHNFSVSFKFKLPLYIFWFLHQTTTMVRGLKHIIMLYIFWFLHQTTTVNTLTTKDKSCISFDSYIKPQPGHSDGEKKTVVYLLIPTSNHNHAADVRTAAGLYIFWFLHQTTTYFIYYTFVLCCISFDSYIKPQLHWVVPCLNNVVYLLIPTSNHNVSKCVRT